MKSRGTKETQGINGDAAALQNRLAAMARRGGQIGAPCSYSRHRSTDWITPESQVVCGICHPPAAEFDGIVRRGEPGFDDLAAAARTRIFPAPDHPRPISEPVSADEGAQGDLWTTAA